MEQAKKYRLMDLIEDIKKTDEMIHLHSGSDALFMQDQYKDKKQKLVGYLIDELVEPDVRSTKNFSIIQIVITKFYPDLKNDAAADLDHSDLNELESILG